MYINNTQTHTHTHTQEQKKEVLGKVQWASESQTVVRFSGGGLAGSRKPVQAITVPWWTPWYHLLWDSVSLGVTMESMNVWWTPISRRQWLVLWSYTGDQVKVLTSTSFQPRQVMNTEVWPKPHQWATSTTPYQLSDKRTHRRWVNRILFALLIETLSWKMRKISIREMKRSRLPSANVLPENVVKGRGSSFMHELTDRHFPNPICSGWQSQKTMSGYFFKSKYTV